MCDCIWGWFGDLNISQKVFRGLGYSFNGRKIVDRWVMNINMATNHCCVYAHGLVCLGKITRTNGSCNLIGWSFLQFFGQIWDWRTLVDSWTMMDIGTQRMNTTSTSPRSHGYQPGQVDKNDKPQNGFWDQILEINRNDLFILVGPKQIPQVETGQLHVK